MKFASMSRLRSGSGLVNTDTALWGLAARGGPSPLGELASQALHPLEEGVRKGGLSLRVCSLFLPDISAFPQAVPSPDAADSTR